MRGKYQRQKPCLPVVSNVYAVVSEGQAARHTERGLYCCPAEEAEAHEIVVVVFAPLSIHASPVETGVVDEDLQRLLRQKLYFCTSKASELST